MSPQKLKLKVLKKKKNGSHPSASKPGVLYVLTKIYKELEDETLSFP